MAVRERTLAIARAVGEREYRALHAPVVGPIAWDLPHVASFEELWLVRRLGPDGARYRSLSEGIDPTYDASLHPRPERAALDLPTRREAVRKLARVRRETLRALDRLDPEGPDPLTRGLFAHEMVLRHECQHQETMLVTLQTAKPGTYSPLHAPKPEPAVRVSGMVRVPAGPFVMGRPQAPGVYDNESPPRVVDLPEFWIDRAPVTNGEFRRFVEAGGYEREELWSEDGWLLRTLLGWRHPAAWSRDPTGAWTSREFDRIRPLRPDLPVVHVSWYEAEAYARFVGKRLPTEAEWEKAATWDPAARRKRLRPWGPGAWTPERANLDQRLAGPAPVGSYPEGASPVGCHQMLGDVWEWTATEFAPYPGFEAFPYDGYSVPFFRRGFYVLRGGSFATSAEVATGTFRNWHEQGHQQEFAGIRLASDRAPEEAR